MAVVQIHVIVFHGCALFGIIQAAKNGIEWMPEIYRAKSLKQDIINNEDLGPELIGLTEPLTEETNSVGNN